VVPSLEEATNNFPFTSSIPIPEIVQRVKCELSDALDEKTQQREFLWMATWTAKIDLTLEVNETGGVSPSAVFIQPLRTIAGTAQSFNFGFGANLSGSADRTELLSFAVSLEELRIWRKRLRQFEAQQGLSPDSLCRPLGINDLQGGLGLKSWIDSALLPVETHDLRQGNHPDPGSVAKAPSAKSTSPGVTAHGGPPLTAAERAPYDFKLDTYLAQITAFATAAQKSAEQAAGVFAQLTSPTSTTHMFDKRIASLSWWARQQAFATKKANDDAQKYASDKSNKTINKETYEDDLNNVEADLRISGLNAGAAASNASLATKLASPDPPIDSITHSVNFVVTAGGSISPNWTFVKWKGPTTSGTLASLSAVRTHSLNIALGSPSGPGLVEVDRVLSNQAFRQAVQTIGGTQ
jgi:hypothetical protein